MVLPEQAAQYCDRVDAVFLDVDGVVLDSVHLKERAFRAMIQEKAPQHLDAAMKLFLEHGGVSRRVKFLWIFRDLCGEQPTDAQLDALSAEFADRVYQQMLACPFIPGAEEFLRDYHPLRPLFLISGTPQPELRRIITARGIDRLVAGIFGSPDTKTVIGERLIAEYNLRRDRLWFVGDATTDRDAARALGIAFVGLDGPHLTPYMDGDEVVIRDLRELPGVLLGTSAS